MVVPAHGSADGNNNTRHICSSSSNGSNSSNSSSNSQSDLSCFEIGTILRGAWNRWDWFSLSKSSQKNGSKFDMIQIMMPADPHAVVCTATSRVTSVRTTDCKY